MEKFKYINYCLGVVVLVLAGCATQPNALEEQKRQHEATQKKIDEMNATLNEQRGVPKKDGGIGRHFE